MIVSKRVLYLRGWWCDGVYQFDSSYIKLAISRRKRHPFLYDDVFFSNFVLSSFVLVQTASRRFGLFGAFVLVWDFLLRGFSWGACYILPARFVCRQDDGYIIGATRWSRS
jgi:hypothetical protein